MYEETHTSPAAVDAHDDSTGTGRAGDPAAAHRAAARAQQPHLLMLRDLAQDIIERVRRRCLRAGHLVGWKFEVQEQCILETVQYVKMDIENLTLSENRSRAFVFGHYSLPARTPRAPVHMARAHLFDSMIKKLHEQEHVRCARVAP